MIPAEARDYAMSRLPLKRRLAASQVGRATGSRPSPDALGQRSPAIPSLIPSSRAFNSRMEAADIRLRCALPVTNRRRQRRTQPEQSGCPAPTATSGPLLVLGACPVASAPPFPSRTRQAIEAVSSVASLRRRIPSSFRATRSASAVALDGRTRGTETAEGAQSAFRVSLDSLAALRLDLADKRYEPVASTVSITLFEALLGVRRLLHEAVLGDDPIAQ